MDKELTIVKEKLEKVSNHMGEMNRELESKIGEMNATMGGVEASVEVMKGYLQDLKESLVGRETKDKGKASMDQDPSLSNPPPFSVHWTSLLERSEEIGGEEQTTKRG